MAHKHSFVFFFSLPEPIVRTAISIRINTHTTEKKCNNFETILIFGMCSVLIFYTAVLI